MNKDITIANQIINGFTISNNPNYRETYMWTTENIRGLLTQLSLADKTIFTVCSSGDHIFNFLLEGATNIVAFDINPFTEYIYYLKKSAITTLKYKEFLDFFFPKFFFTKTFNKNTYNKIREDLPKGKIQDFWDQLFNQYSPKELYTSKLFIKNSIDNKSLTICNKYLNNEINYNILKERLKKFPKLEFHQLNIFEPLPPTTQKFDFIYLSNILDNLNYKTDKEMLKAIKQTILKLSNLVKEDGIIAICYVYFYLDGYWSIKKTSNIPNLILEGNFPKTEYQIIDFRSSQNLKSTNSEDMDGVILTKKKNKTKQK